MTGAMRGRLTRMATGGVLVAAIVAGNTGCKPYRIEYHNRPGFLRRAQVGELPDQVTLSDGTVIVFKEREITSGLKPRDHEGAPVTRIREETETGTVTLRAMVPEDVLANTLNCLRNEEYELLWDQMVADQTKSAYEAQGQGQADFAAFMKRNRFELAATLTRMLLGLSRQQAFLENVGDGVISCRFHPQIATEFRFTAVDVVSEPGGLRLLMIR